jgi:hypothetical protein
MVNFANLVNKKEARKIRDVVLAGNDKIVVYEPTIDEVDKIINGQEDFIKGVRTGEISLDGVYVVKELFPLLTDIEGIGDLTDKEIKDVVENPSLAYLQVEQSIKGIIVEIFRSLVIASKTELLEADLIRENENIQNSALDAIFKKIAQESNSEDLLQKIEVATQNMIKAKEKERMASENVVNIEDFKEDKMTESQKEDKDKDNKEDKEDKETKEDKEFQAIKSQAELSLEAFKKQFGR